MAKRISGEQSIKIGSKTYTLRLDFQALADIEDHLDGPITDYFQRKASPKLTDVAILFASLAHIERAEAWEAVKANGLPESLAVVTAVVVKTLMPEESTTGKPKARQTKTPA